MVASGVHLISSKQSLFRTSMNRECKEGRFENIVVKLGFDIICFFSFFVNRNSSIEEIS